MYTQSAKKKKIKNREEQEIWGQEKTKIQILHLKKYLKELRERSMGVQKGAIQAEGAVDAKALRLVSEEQQGDQYGQGGGGEGTV